ncbi:glucan -beta-glucosidase [Colletotrichum karsti]|uniref:Glucan -beta-glucosidase n=1 Tax=Colletotrichum karsti TaxID=1095194 RepID=A0A9P6IAN4_9PEZI|nr:glucan -beta-glucosidase [Colletotrichum karsti]KAF9878857.1 glucan -beta-glucosidase [Colletotrichum karsti]
MADTSPPENHLPLPHGDPSPDRSQPESSSAKTSTRPSARGTAFYQRKRAVKACQVGATCIQSPVDLSSFDPASLKILERLDDLEELMRSVSVDGSSNKTRVVEVPVETRLEVPVAVGPPIELGMIVPAGPEHVMSWNIFQSVRTAMAQDDYPPIIDLGINSPASVLGDLDMETRRVKQLIDNFFSYVHVKNPILDETATRKMVLSTTMNGIDWSAESCLSLLIFALGSISTPFGPSHETMPGTVTHAKAQEYFRAAQKRLGILLSADDIIAAQCLFLSGVYMMCIFQPVKAWRYFVQALANCQQLPFLTPEAQQRYQNHVESGADSQTYSIDTLQQAIYWSSWKSEREMRGDLYLPDFALSEKELAFYPPFFPTPPAPRAEVEAASDPRLARERTSWYFYLSEISLRRLASRISAEMVGLQKEYPGRQAYLLAAAAATQQYEEQVNEWIASLPLGLSFGEPPEEDDFIDGSRHRAQLTTTSRHLANMSNSTPNPPCTLLRVNGTKIVNENGEEVILKGAAVGGMLNMENFITGYSGHESEHREALAEVLGQEKADFFFSRLLHYYFTEADAALFASLGLNCLRVPFNYRHFIDDANPSVIKKSGFELLDRIVNYCAKYNIYVILDLHAVPGGQNQDWHSDSGISRALFWEFKDFQDRAIQLWEALAAHYKGNKVIAGYNPLNEPADPKHTRLISWYERAEKAIRAIDPDHILFLDGNTYAMDFSAFSPEKTLPNSVYSCHDYSLYGFPLPEQYEGIDSQKQKLRASLKRKVEFMQKARVPIWNGEWGPVYQDPRTDSNAAATNEKRFALLKEQLNIYREFGGISWSIWLYKDIGYQGMVYVDPESPYMRLIRPFVEKKQRLGLDFWGCADKSGIDNEVYAPFISKLKSTLPEHLHKKKYPKTWTFDRQVERVVRECLMSEYHGWEFAELFKGKTEAELEELAASFALENCVKRNQLNQILTADAETANGTNKA